METTQRFVALDVHKQHVMVAAIDATQHVALSPRKISLEQFDPWAQTHLLPTDAVVLEATTNAWTLYDLLAPLVAQVKVAHPFLVKLIASARVKTDRRDILHLARLLLAGLIPGVWVPPKPHSRPAMQQGTPSIGLGWGEGRMRGLGLRGAFLEGRPSALVEGRPPIEYRLVVAAPVLGNLGARSLCLRWQGGFGRAAAQTHPTSAGPLSKSDVRRPSGDA